MSVGVLLDAFVVRTFLIPAPISLFGERSFWSWTRPALVTSPDWAPETV